MQENETLKKVSFEEYLKIEKENGQKYEYHDGYIYAMSGGSINHSTITTNITGKIWSLLDGISVNCQIQNSDLKLKVESKNSYLYPNAMIICGDLEMSDEEKNAITNPRVVIEVLSKSTAAYDRGEKFSLYRQIPSLEYYIMIEQVKIQVEVHRRKEANPFASSIWETHIYEDLNQSVVLSLSDSEEIMIDLKSIYKNVSFA